jgi:hypothetical protein
MMGAICPLTFAFIASIGTTLSAIIEAYKSIQQATNFPLFLLLHFWRRENRAAEFSVAPLRSESHWLLLNMNLTVQKMKSTDNKMKFIINTLTFNVVW